MSEYSEPEERILIFCLLQVTIGFVGLVGNAAIISWFSRKKNIFHRLMTTLAVCDSAYIITNVFIFSLPKIFKR